MRKSLMFFLMVFMCQLVMAQKHKVTGVVKGASDGIGIPGVSVLIQGTSKGTITDFDGNYSLVVENPQATLIFSFIGFETQEIQVAGKTKIDVILEEETKGIEEVIVVGYGTQKKANLTGAVASLSSEALESKPITSLGEGLQGTVANLNVNFSSGEPGRSTSFNVRGTTSLNGGSPLVLVDGVVGDPDMINPDDIKSLSVLKDAAASAVYGARAAFGVILITTKSGSKNKKAKIAYTNNYSFSRPTITPQMADAYEFGEVMREVWPAFKNNNFTDEVMENIANYIADPVNSPNFIPVYNANGDLTGKRHAGNTDWGSALFEDYSPTEKHTLSVSGGSDKVTYYVSAGMQKQDGILKYGNDSFDRYNFNANLTTDVTDWMDMNFKVNYSRTEGDKPAGYGFIGSYWHAAYRSWPTRPITFSDDNEYTWAANPVLYLTEGGRLTKTESNLYITAGSTIKIADGFRIKSDFTYNPYNNASRNHLKKVFYKDYKNDNYTSKITNNSVGRTHNFNNYYAINTYADYEKKFNEVHYFKGMVGFNQEWKEYSRVNQSRKDLISNDIPYTSLATGDITATDAESDWAVRGGFFRMNYIYNDKYLVEFNGRYDGTSRFPQDDRYGFFPSFSAGWRISEEAFFTPLKNVIENLKIRGSYGTLGNQRVGAASDGFAPYLPSMGATAQVNYMFGDARPLGINNPLLVSNSLTWETVKTIDYGVDINLWQKLDITFDWYERQTIDMLVSGNALPAILGAAPPRENLADLSTKGWELTLGWNDRTDYGLKYGLNLVLSDYQAEITEFDNPTNSLAKSHYVGKKIGEIWGYETVGLFQSQEEIDNGPDQSFIYGGKWKPGDVHYADQPGVDGVGDGKIDKGDFTVDNPGDLKIIGNSTPRYSYGIKSNVSWKGVDLSVFVQGVGKRDYWLGGSNLFWGVNNNIWQSMVFKNTRSTSWSEDNPDAYFPRLETKNPSNRNRQKQSRYLQDASFMRLKNVTIGYTFPKRIINPIGLSRVRFYLSGQNLAEWTKLHENYDPEGLGGKIYPFQRSVSFGVNLTL